MQSVDRYQFINDVKGEVEDSLMEEFGEYYTMVSLNVMDEIMFKLMDQFEEIVLGQILDSVWVNYMCKEKFLDRQYAEVLGKIL
jgi:hypothetical protein